MNWIYEGVEIDSIPSNEAYGFTYMIYYDDGTYYWGKKSFVKQVRLKPRKTDRKNAKRIVWKESDWKKYTGSSKEAKGKTVFKKEILELAVSKRALTYLETKLLFEKDVLFDDKCLNSNILGKFYDNVLDPLKQ
jgi:hypothetical protein